MKKILSITLMFLLLFTFPLLTYADNSERSNSSAVSEVVVPENCKVIYEETFPVEIIHTDKSKDSSAKTSSESQPTTSAAGIGNVKMIVSYDYVNKKMYVTHQYTAPGYLITGSSGMIEYEAVDLEEGGSQAYNHTDFVPTSSYTAVDSIRLYAASSGDQYIVTSTGQFYVVGGYSPYTRTAVCTLE